MHETDNIMNKRDIINFTGSPRTRWLQGSNKMARRINERFFNESQLFPFLRYYLKQSYAIIKLNWSISNYEREGNVNDLIEFFNFYL